MGSHIRALQHLDLSDNRLTALPETFGQLAALRVLHLQRNQLTALPEAVGQLAALQHFCLNQNQLTALPETFGQLTALRTLLLNQNLRVPIGAPQTVFGYQEKGPFVAIAAAASPGKKTCVLLSTYTPDALQYESNHTNMTY